MDDYYKFWKRKEESEWEIKREEDKQIWLLHWLVSRNELNFISFYIVILINFSILIDLPKILPLELI